LIPTSVLTAVLAQASALLVLFPKANSHRRIKSADEFHQPILTFYPLFAHNLLAFYPSFLPGML